MYNNFRPVFKKTGSSELPPTCRSRYFYQGECCGTFLVFDDLIPRSLKGFTSKNMFNKFYFMDD